MEDIFNNEILDFELKEKIEKENHSRLYILAKNSLRITSIFSFSCIIVLNGGRFFISFTEKRYSRYDSIGGLSLVESLDSEVFFEW